MLDTNTEFGQRVARRLGEERIAWLTTVGSDGTPQAAGALEINFDDSNHSTPTRN